MPSLQSRAFHLGHIHNILLQSFFTLRKIFECFEVFPNTRLVKQQKKSLPLKSQTMFQNQNSQQIGDLGTWYGRASIQVAADLAFISASPIRTAPPTIKLLLPQWDLQHPRPNSNNAHYSNRAYSCYNKRVNSS